MSKSPTSKEVRCAVYTRKSTEEGLEQEFNSLDAQREAGEAYIRSQKHAGWTLLPHLYDDGGFTGGNADRPALKQLFRDIEAGEIDCVVVYKVDRLSRSLLDFSRMMEAFERHGVAFVSVTQRFYTSDSMGRLTLNMLMSFAQFEREMISERTRDKIAATRRKGKWTGGMPVLGYDVVASKLIVNDVEAAQVKQIFQIYLECGGLLATLKQIRQRGWKTKQWTTKKKTTRGGQPFCRSRLHHLLTNPTYIGKVRYKQEVCEGEHPGIVPLELFERVQVMLRSKGHTSQSRSPNKYGALLKGLLHCKHCNCQMSHTYTSKGGRRYRYYVCVNAQQCGRKACPAPSLPAVEIERFVVDQIKGMGRDPKLADAVIKEVRLQLDFHIQSLKTERANLDQQIRTANSQLATLLAQNTSTREEAAELRSRIATLEHSLSGMKQTIQDHVQIQFTDGDVRRALVEFNSLWESLEPAEQTETVDLLVEQVVYDAEMGDVSIKFRQLGWHAISRHVTAQKGDAA